MAKSLVSFSADISQALAALQKANKQATNGLFRSTQHAAASIRKTMIESMQLGNAGKAVEVAPGRFKRGRERSKPGQPPFKQTGRLARSIRYEADNKSARIYSEYQGTGKRKNNDFLARIMESGTYKMAPRPFTKPALDKSLSRLPLLLKTDVTAALNS